MDTMKMSFAFMEIKNPDEIYKTFERNSPNNELIFKYEGHPFKISKRMCSFFLQNISERNYKDGKHSTKWYMTLLIQQWKRSWVQRDFYKQTIEGANF